MQRVIDDIHHKDVENALRALSAGLVELNDRFPDDAEAPGFSKAYASDIQRGKWPPYVSRWGH
jgi:hypothetical protein